MGCRGFVLCLAVIMVATMWCENAAEPNWHNCEPEVIKLDPCLAYVRGKGDESALSTTCCSRVSTLVKSIPQCLCFVFNSGPFIFGIPINQTLAHNLPAACKVKTPPASILCKDFPPSF
uniref:Non-specific lipid-transfer protein-like protein At5g64080 family n=1 Tax=Cajanus cajan TaxID=3821 RepID=A0A151U4A2_CAJCA|nr:Non-specific lipid-transfer protein-like protein At5g64080 family [Cajanus cajan]